MKQKHVGVLSIVLILLVGLSYFLNQGPQSHPEGTNEVLLKGVDANSIAKLVLQKGEESVELKKSIDGWVIPARSDYATDRAKINALFLKLFDISVSQKLPASEADLSGFGVTDEQVKAGKTKVTMFSDQGSEIASIYLGEQRKTRGESSAMPSVGEFVRRGGSNDVFLVPEVITVATTIPAWLEASVANVLQSAVVGVKQIDTSGGEDKVVYEVAREVPSDPTSKLVVKTGLAANDALNEPALAQAGSALENLNLTDVDSASSDTSKALTFDGRTEVTTSGGMVYVVQSAEKTAEKTAEKDGSGYIKLSAKLDADIVRELADREAEAKAKEEAAKASSSSAGELSSSSSQSSSGSSSSSSSSSAAKPTIKPATEASVKEFNDKHAPWVYKLDSFREKKFRMTAADFKKIESK